MNAVALQSFGFGDQLVRATEREGNVWFVANDVCAELEIGNSRQAVSRLEDDEKDCVTISDAIGRERETTIVSESGVYALIFKSRKPQAKQFRKWVTGEVLPALRREGVYMTADNDQHSDFAVPNLGTRDERDALRVAVLMVREMKDLYGQKAGRQMWVKLGFPDPEVDLAPAPPAPDEPPEQPEGDLHKWSIWAKLKPTKADATHYRDLFANYVEWCSQVGAKPMEPDRFKRLVIMLFGHEEHPEMICVILTRK